MLASDFRMGALISCLNFLACSLVLAPKVGGRYGGRYGRRDDCEACGASSEEESEVVRSMISLPELIVVNVVKICDFGDECVFYGKDLGFE